MACWIQVAGSGVTDADMMARDILHRPKRYSDSVVPGHGTWGGEVCHKVSPAYPALVYCSPAETTVIYVTSIADCHIAIKGILQGTHS